MIQFIDDHKEEFGVEPICRHLPIAPQTYYAAKGRPPSKRALSDEIMAERIYQIHKINYGVYGVYGVRKVHAELRRNGEQVARCTVERLMKKEGLRGIRRAKGPRTTIPGPLADRPSDLVDRRFTATAPDCLWVADITYIRTFSGWVYAAFVIDVFARRVVGWQLSTSLHTDLALDALEMGIWTRRRAGRDLSPADSSQRPRSSISSHPIHRPSRHAEAVASVGSKGDSYDNALAEAFNSLFKAELIRNKGPWRGINDLEIATAEYIDWFNHRRLHGEIGHRPPIEVENEFLNSATPAITTMERV